MDLGIEWLHQDEDGCTVWLRCGCIGVLGEDGSHPAFVTSALYHGEGHGTALAHDADLCPGRSRWMHELPMRQKDRKRAAQLVIQQRWLDGGGCPVHNQKACVH